MEIRRFHIETRAEVSGDTLRGHAAVFNQYADVRGHYEAIAPTAFNGVLERSDVRALVNHDPNRLLARQSSGTLRLRTDSQGLEFEIDLPDTQEARDLRVLVDRGDLSGASFGFMPGQSEWSRARDGKQLQTHTAIEALRDVSPVTFPAYDSTEVALRGVDFDLIDQRSRLVRARAHARGITR